MEIYNSQGEKDTYELGIRMGKEALPGDIYLLDGDLGVGKTVFAKGFAIGLGITEPVTSPTFTIVEVYEGGRLPFYHFDVYRIDDPDEMYEIGYEEYFFGEGVTLIEWPSRIDTLIPKEAVKISIQKEIKIGLDFRRITVS